MAILAFALLLACRFVDNAMIAIQRVHVVADEIGALDRLHLHARPLVQQVQVHRVDGSSYLL